MRLSGAVHGIFGGNCHGAVSAGGRLYVNRLPRFANGRHGFVHHVSHDRRHGCSVFVGNSHLVIFDDNEKILKMMKKDDKELYKTNINVVTPLTKNMIKVDTFEKGVGRTLSCGTGALASSIAYKLKTDCKEDIIVHYELGELIIKEDEYCYHLIGEARFLAKIEANI